MRFRRFQSSNRHPRFTLNSNPLPLRLDPPPACRPSSSSALLTFAFLRKCLQYFWESTASFQSMMKAGDAHHNADASAAAAAEDEAAAAAAASVLEDAAEGPEFSFLRYTCCHSAVCYCTCSLYKPLSFLIFCSDLIAARRGHPQGDALPSPIVKARINPTFMQRKKACHAFKC